MNPPHSFSNIRVPCEVFTFSVTLGMYHNMITHYITKYVSTLDKKERKNSYGYNIYPKNTYNESK